MTLAPIRCIVEAILKDTRISSPSGQAPEEDMVPVHDLVARIWVQGPDLTLVAVEAEMLHIPRETCREVLPDLQKLVGIKDHFGLYPKSEGSNRERERLRPFDPSFYHSGTGSGPGILGGLWPQAGRPVARQPGHYPGRGQLPCLAQGRPTGPPARCGSPKAS